MRGGAIGSGVGRVVLVAVLAVLTAGTVVAARGRSAPATVGVAAVIPWPTYRAGTPI